MVVPNKANSRHWVIQLLRENEEPQTSVKNERADDKITVSVAFVTGLTEIPSP